MKRKTLYLLTVFLLILLTYTTNITSLPDKIILFKDEDIDLNILPGIGITKIYNSEDKTINVFATVNESNKQKIKISLFNTLDIKNIEVERIELTKVIPLGDIVGLKLYTNGVLVIGKTEINGKKPYKDSSIEEGDIIIAVNDEEVTNIDELTKHVNNSNGSVINLKYIRQGEEHLTSIKPIETEKGVYKIGLWVRDGAAGVGTITYYEPKTGEFGALGHPIVDIDTDKIIDIKDGEIVKADVSVIKKGETGKPGEIRGSIKNKAKICTIFKNSEYGIYGKVNNIESLDINKGAEIDVATRKEIKLGDAYILLKLDKDEKKEYKVEIVKTNTNNYINNKSMLVKVTDEELLRKTRRNYSRYEWCSNCAKWEIYRSNNTCISARSNSRICCFWRYDDKTNERN